MPTASGREGRERKKWVEPVAALLMALATLSTAWRSYQSAAWTRKSNGLMNEFNTLERRAGLLTMQGTQQATIHAAMFMQLLAAQQAGNEKLVNFYVERFPPDVRHAYDAWLAQKPLENPNADPHPFVPNLYEPRGHVKRPTRPRRRRPVSSRRVKPATFPDSTSRTLFYLPQFFSSPARPASSSSSACAQWRSLSRSRSLYLRSCGRRCFRCDVIFYPSRRRKTKVQLPNVGYC